MPIGATYALDIGLIMNTFVTTVTTTSSTLLLANTNRKYLLLKNVDHSGSSTVYVRFDASPVTITGDVSNGFPLENGIEYTFPKGFIYTGEIRVITDSTNTPFAVIEGS